MNPEFNFDYWSKLFKENSEEFERRRKEEIEKVINAASTEESKQRLRQLQWTIDAERSTNGSPLGATIKMYRRMWDSFMKLNGKLQELTGNDVSSPAVVREANVLTFIRKQK